MTIEDKPLKRCTEWRGEHAAVFDHGVNFIDRLAQYEDTGLTPEQIVALRAQQEDEKFSPPCYQPEQFGGGCVYQCYDGDDEPIDKCKECPLYNSDKHRDHQEAEKNEPLTLGELRQMGGEPAYIVPRYGKREWSIVEPEIDACLSHHNNYHFEEYGDFWLAYRRPQKEAHNAV